MTKNELSKETLIIEFKLSFYYDKPFYFITIKEENKFSIQKSDNKMYKILIPNTLKSNNIKKIHSNINNDKKSRNPHIIFIENNKRSDLYNSLNFNNAKKQIEKKIIITEKIEKFEFEIKKDKSLLIKTLLFFIILFTFIIYIIIIFQRRILINITEKFFLTCFYNYHTRDIIISLYSKLIALYHEISGVSALNKAEESEKKILSFSQTLREKYHNFNRYFSEYNLEIGNPINIVYDEKIFFKLREKWQEIPYISTFSSELDLVIYTITLINITNTIELNSDVKNFLFYEGNLNHEDKVNTPFIKLLFYFGINYENTYKEFYSNINSEIYSSIHLIKNIIQEVRLFIIY